MTTVYDSTEIEALEYLVTLTDEVSTQVHLILKTNDGGFINVILPDTNGNAPAASTTIQGLVEIATEAETLTGVDTLRVVTPATLAAALFYKANVDSLAAVAVSGDAGDLTGVLPSECLPPLGITEVYAPADLAAMLALTAQRGEVAVRQDNSQTYILSTDDPTVFANWKPISSAGGSITVNGHAGPVITLVKADVNLGNVDNTSDVNKPISTATQTALDLKADTSAMTTALAAKANSSDVTTGLAAKADASAMTTALAAKADSSSMTTALAAKADSSAMATALAAKADDTATTTALATKAADSAVVKLTGAQSIAGVKTFGAVPIIPDATASTEAINRQTADARFARIPIRDTSANLAANNPVGIAGQLIQATTAPYLEATSDGATGWNSLPKRFPVPLALPAPVYTETYITGVSNTAVLWTGMQITFTSDGVTPLEGLAYCPAVNGADASVTAGTAGGMKILDGAIEIAYGYSAMTPVAAAAGRMGACICMFEPRVFSAGSHTLYLYVFRQGGAGTLTFYAQTGPPLMRAFLRVRPALIL